MIMLSDFIYLVFSMPIAENVIGKTFNFLKVVSLQEIRRFKSGGTERYYKCVCECGNETVVGISNLRCGMTKSCGCLQLKKATSHAGSYTPEYRVWIAIKSRCFNRSTAGYKNYGGRGIKVCDRWKDSFENFHADMGDRPEGMTLERIDNDGDYCPENCRWATRKEQANNRRTNKTYTYKGKTLNMKQWAEHLGVSYDLIKNRLKRGWGVKRAFETPPNRSNQ